MTASSRGARATALLINLGGASRNPRMCSQCISNISRISARRAYAVESNVLDPVPNLPPIVDQKAASIAPVTASQGSTPYITKTGILLSRPPLLTRNLTSFEKAFFFYQKRLNERLALPFTRYFYFKKGSPADADWKLKAKDRGGAAARDLGGYNAYGEFGWNDELLVGDKLSDPQTTVESLVKDSVVRAVEGKDGQAVEVKLGEGEEAAKIDMPEPRETAADQENLLQALDRKLDRTLYLCVQRKNGGWGFPAGEMIGRESLHQAAERILVQTAGLNMNTWIVGNAPIGYYIVKPYKEKPGERTFFMKGRIMAGQANLAENIYELGDFKWLTREEIEKLVSPKYFSYVRNMLADR
ncbi:hypothetical protein HYALB_00002755 [Hymenoscyphus albidus]|uniref:Large ribosomal subunit protein mL46 n=1 Tax=Hymenoscyphus albidus TaxID=595503 RepID=A0A9N9LF80_9HELO|nr:hypothetical protein HYALB_00002755 [Hymenoscyphus albidus]